MRIEESQSNIVTLSDIRNERLRALSPYGPVRAGLTTLPTTNEVRLMELLSSLESVVADLNSKSYTALDTLTTAIRGVRVALLPTTNEAGTDETP